MTTISNPINLPRQPVPWTNARNWAANPTGTPVTLNGKNTTSIAPQNTVEPTWRDALDAINPLHQIPVVGEIYRGITGEKISGIARVAGGFIFGGVAGGLVAAMVAAYAEGHDDQGPGEQLVAALAGDKTAAAAAAPDKAGAAPAAIMADKTGAGLAADDIPTVTITAQDAANLQLPSQPAFARQPAPEPTAAVTKEAAKTVAIDGRIPTADGQKTVAPETFALPPLREKLNAKRPTPGFSAAPHPLNLSSFIDRLPAKAANLSLNQPDNLALLQSVNSAPNPAAALTNTPVTTVANNEASQSVVSERNPLPPELVRDMMLQALDKYENLPAVTAEPDNTTE